MVNVHHWLIIEEGCCQLGKLRTFGNTELCSTTKGLTSKFIAFRDCSRESHACVHYVPNIVMSMKSVNKMKGIEVMHIATNILSPIANLFLGHQSRKQII